MSKEIPLTKGKSAIVDDDLYWSLSQIKWHYSGGYAVYFEKKTRPRKAVRMHRLINNTPEGMDTDHINGNKLDNRRANLRTCSRSANVSWGIERKRKSSIVSELLDEMFVDLREWVANLS